MATSQYTYHPYHTIGAASVLLWDPAAGGAGAWRPLGKVADAAVLITTEQVGKDLTLKGLTQPIARRNRAKRYSLTFRLLEDANPLTLDLLFADGASQAASPPQLVAVSEVTRLFSTDWRELAHPYGLRAELPGGVTDPGASSGSSGGSIPPGTYYYWIVPYTTCGGVIFEGEAVATGQLLVVEGEKVTITFTPPASYTPEGYRVYFSNNDSLIEANLAGAGNGSPIVLSEHAGSPAYSPQSTPLVEVWDYAGAVQYVLDTDYALDARKGLIKRLAGGSIPEGGQVVVTYAYQRPASVLTDLGDPVALERYRRVKLLQLAPDDPDPEQWLETGVEFTMFKVNVSLNDSRWPFSEDEFSEGASVTWDCLFDGDEGQVGTVRSTYGVLAAYE